MKSLITTLFVMSLLTTVARADEVEFEFISGCVQKSRFVCDFPAVTGTFGFEAVDSSGRVVFQSLTFLRMDVQGLSFDFPQPVLISRSRFEVTAVLANGDLLGLSGPAVWGSVVGGMGQFFAIDFSNDGINPNTGIQIRFPNVATVWTTGILASDIMETLPLPGQAPESDHFLSYDIKKPKGEPKFEKFPVMLADQFQIDLFTVEKRVSLLNPVDKNGEGISDPDTHLVGYKVKQVRPEGAPKPPKDPRIGIEIKDQFFDKLIVDISDINKVDRLLVPASKDLDELPSPPDGDSHAVDHFLCYKVRLPKGTEFPKDIQITLADQFIDPDGIGVNQLFDLKKPKRLCNPVDKNGEGIKNEENHLICYQVKRPKVDPGFTPISRTVELRVNPFVCAFPVVVVF